MALASRHSTLQSTLKLAIRPLLFSALPLLGGCGTGNNSAPVDNYSTPNLSRDATPALMVDESRIQWLEIPGIVAPLTADPGHSRFPKVRCDVRVAFAGSPDSQQATNAEISSSGGIAHLSRKIRELFARETAESVADLNIVHRLETAIIEAIRVETGRPAALVRIVNIAVQP